ncbi:Cytochrome c [Sulfidibacter corallicola]|uniref:Cytochrome c n=1 Tax=Sulfidibacter corallicola TaxID=2818388 RepID=A0A8A4TT68_SULCO|nr:cytochrome c [Sulfidibacter corallicola]QTD52278.1 cytochrome c [Sulfidibacter corallicola]
MFVYTRGTERPGQALSETQMEGKLAWQKHNCSACHQRFGLGGYMGPDLTRAYSRKGEAYLKAVLEFGVGNMPKLALSDDEIDGLVAYMKALDACAPPAREEVTFTWYGVVKPRE